MESLKIAFFCWESLYGERVGGLASAAANLAENLAKSHEVHYFSRVQSRARWLITSITIIASLPAAIPWITAMT